MRPLLLDASGHQEVEVKDTKRQLKFPGTPGLPSPNSPAPPEPQLATQRGTRESPSDRPHDKAHTHPGLLSSRGEAKTMEQHYCSPGAPQPLRSSFPLPPNSPALPPQLLNSPLKGKPGSHHPTNHEKMFLLAEIEAKYAKRHNAATIRLPGPPPSSPDTTTLWSSRGRGGIRDAKSDEQPARKPRHHPVFTPAWCPPPRDAPAWGSES